MFSNNRFNIPQTPIAPQARGSFKLQRPGKAMVILLALFSFFLILVPLFTSLLGNVVSRPEAMLKIGMVLQDIFVFTLPPLITAMIATRLPARLLALDVKPNLTLLMLSVATLVCSMPAMNFVIEWNKGWHLPASMSGVEQLFRSMEENAQAVTDSLMAGCTIPSLIVSVLIVGVLAGFSEELFFRGGMQRIMTAGKTNSQVAVWAVAIIFSLIHFQFFGFVPRMLLGAFFGYLLVWTGSVWIPMIVHMVNNSLVVVSTWWSVNHPSDSGMDLDKIGTDLSTPGGWVSLMGSILLTAVGLYLIYHNSRATKE